MNRRPSSLVYDERAAVDEFINEQLERVFIKGHSIGHTDDGSISEAIQRWLQQKRYETIDGQVARNAKHVRDLHLAVEEAKKDLAVMRSSVLQQCDEVDCGANNSDAQREKDSEGKSQKRHIDPTKVDLEEEFSARRGEDLSSAEMLSNPTGVQSAATEDEDGVDCVALGGEDKKGGSTKFAMLRFIIAMGENDSITAFTPTQILQMLNKCEAMLRDLPAKVTVESDWVLESARRGGDARLAVDEAIAAFIYSVDAKDCDCRSVAECLRRQLEDTVSGKEKHRTQPQVPSNQKVLGPQGSHWAMMNWTDRILGDDSAVKSLDKDSVALLEKSKRFFAPLRTRLNSGLKIFPREPRVVFRGITVPVAHKYSLGSQVRFSPFTSTSLDGEEALKFMRKGGTYFVISTHSGSMIADFSHYPEQAEALMRTNREFIVTSKMSGTLQQILGNDFDVVFMSEKDSPLDEKRTIRQLVEGMRTTQFVYSSYARSYVEGRVSQDPPPLGAKLKAILSSEANDTTMEGLGRQSTASTVIDSVEQRAFPLYKATEHFVNGLTIPYMLLLGAGGAGKTSALIGSLCHLMKTRSRHSLQLLPTFVSLPSVGAAVHEPSGLDKHIQSQLRLSDTAFDIIHSEARVVLLLDSLDEVVPHPDTKASILAVKLLQINPWVGRCKVILSCRTEFIDEFNRQSLTKGKDSEETCIDIPTIHSTTAHYDVALHENPELTLTYHVWPFSEDDRDTFMRQAASDRIEQLAKREAREHYIRMRDTFQLTDDQLSHPCILRIATSVVTSQDAAADAVLEGGDSPAEAIGSGRTELHNLYTLYDTFIRNAISVEGFSIAVVDRIVHGLREIAVEMATAKVWHMRVGDVRRRINHTLLLEDPVKKNAHGKAASKQAPKGPKPTTRKSSNSTATTTIPKASSASKDGTDLLKIIPCRCEDVHNDDALWAFWHKTVGEHLAAQAVVADKSRAATISSNLVREHPVIAHMLSLSELDTYNFGASPPDIPGTISRLAGMSNCVRSINLEKVCVAGQTSVEEWITVNLGAIGAAVAKGDLELVMPTFTELKKLWSFKLPVPPAATPVTTTTASKKKGETSTTAKSFTLTLDLTESFPSVEEIKEGFNVYGCGVLYLPNCPRLSAIPDEFLVSSRNQIVQVKCRDVDEVFNEVTTIGKRFMALRNEKDEGGTNGESTSVGEVLSLSPLVSVTIPTFQNVIRVDRCFMKATPIKHLHWAQDTFTNLQEVEDDFLCSAQQLESLTLPIFNEVKFIGDRFLQSATKLRTLSFAGVEQSAGDSDKDENVTDENLDNGTLSSASSCLPNLLTIETDFCSGLSSLDSVKRFPHFPRLETVGDGFFAKSGLNAFDFGSSSHGSENLPDDEAAAAENILFKALRFKPNGFFEGTTTFSLPSHWENRLQLPSSGSMDTILEAVNTAGVVVISLEAMNNERIDARTWMDAHLKSFDTDHPVTLVFPAFYGKTFHCRWTFPRRCMNYLHCDMTLSAPNALTIPKYGLRNVTMVTIPMFESLTEVPASFMGLSEIRHIKAHRKAMAKVRSIQGGFFHAIVGLESVQLPQFASCESIGRRFLVGCVRRVSMPLDGFPCVKDIEEGFLYDTKELVELDMPRFKSLTSIAKDFLAFSKLPQLVLPNDGMPKMKNKPKGNIFSRGSTVLPDHWKK